MNSALKNRSAIITGANQGLGLAIAKAYVRAGANVLVCARNENLLNLAYQELQTLTEPGQVVIAESADVANPEDANRIARSAMNTFGTIEILVNNAGIHGPKGAIEAVDWDEWISAIQVNLFGSVLMCRAVLPHFKAQKYGKIVQISGGGATNPMPGLSAYAASKAGVIRFAETLAEEVRQDGIDVNSIAPGALNTRLLDDVIEAGPEKVGQAFYEAKLKQKAQGGEPLETAASLAVYLAAAVSDGITGKLISAVWDPWAELTDHRDDLKGDVYTLRRIVPKDRGQTWGDK